MEMDRIQRRVFLIMAAVILLLTGGLIFREFHRNSNKLGTHLESVSISPQGMETAAPVITPAPPETPIRIYVTGHVKHPGVLTVNEDCRLTDALTLAGGALEGADLTRINLAERVRDEGMYYIPLIGEDVPAVSSLSTMTHVSSPDGKVNINTADQRLLETLDGIGPARAQKIIEYREINGGFTHLEELLNISGIGDKILAGLRERVTLR